MDSAPTLNQRMPFFSGRIHVGPAKSDSHLIKEQRSYVGSPCSVTTRQKWATGEPARSGMDPLPHTTSGFLVPWQRDQPRTLRGRALISGTFHTFETGIGEVQKSLYRSVSVRRGKGKNN